MIAIVNWQTWISALKNEDKDTADETGDSVLNPQSALQNVFPIMPGKTDGHVLNTLDNRYFRGTELEFITNLPDIVIINDEAHHIHEIDQYEDVVWQQIIDRIAENKGQKFVQIDFSATPYGVGTTGRGKNKKRVRNYFPHIIVDFELKTAIHQGLVKIIALDKQMSLESPEFRAERLADGKLVGLSQGQKTMLDAGLTKLKILEENFYAYTQDDTNPKHPKMLVICEDTTVSPLVVDYLKKYKNLSEGEIVQIDSNAKGDVTATEWKKVRRELFNIDSRDNPKVIISVMMLREGFDVNNICVIVPLRTAGSDILLEQIIGRGLRLMWRGGEHEEIKAENRKLVLQEKRPPKNYLDILSIIDHPNFDEFYKKFVEDATLIETTTQPKSSGEVLGDLCNLQLKDGYEKFDMFFPVIVRDCEEEIISKPLNWQKLGQFSGFSFPQLKQFVKKNQNAFISNELTVGTQFGKYTVSPDILNASGYNDYLGRIIYLVANTWETNIGRRKEVYPVMAFNQVQLAGSIDKYIRKRLFKDIDEFDPLEDDNWQVLKLEDVVRFIVKELSNLIFEMQQNTEISEAEVEKIWFSSVPRLKVRESFVIPVVKSIFDRLPFPSSQGGLEKAFIEFCDNDSQVEQFIKIREYDHIFAFINYVREDGMIRRYFPDFMVKVENDIYLVETKAQKDESNYNVRSKKRSALKWCEKINALKPEVRMDCKWTYCLVSDDLFYRMKENNADIVDLLEYAAIKMDASTAENLVELAESPKTV
jgi:type III restriction enzyme